MYGVCGTVLPDAVGKNASELSGWLAVYESVDRFPCRLLWEISGGMGIAAPGQCLLRARCTHHSALCASSVVSDSATP